MSPPQTFSTITTISSSKSAAKTAPSSSPHVIFPEAKHYLSKSHHFSTFCASHPPALLVAPGELIHVETLDCFSGRITRPEHTHLDLDDSLLNPVTGPIYVKGAMPGDILSVRLHDIRPNALGVSCCSTDEGQLCHLIQNDCAPRFFDISENGMIIMVEDGRRSSRIAPISFPASPMLGVIGLAPEGQEPIPTMPAGKHGGNLDNKLNGIGCVIHLPVKHPGALLSVGDMHASQGDGEICGTGVEVGGHVLLSCDIIKQKDLVMPVCEYPVTETETHWVTHGVAVEDIPQATKVACEEACKLLMGQWGFSAEEAFMFLSVKGDLGLCQSCHPDVGTQIAKMMVPKIEACPRPFRL